MDEPNTDWDGAVGVEAQGRHLLEDGEYPHGLELPDVQVWCPDEGAELPRQVDEGHVWWHVEPAVCPWYLQEHV